MTESLTDRGYFVPGWAKMDDRSYWLYPFPVPNKNQFKDFAIANGLMVYRGATQISLVPIPEEVKEREGYIGTPNCSWLIENSVWLPVNCHLSQDMIDKVEKRTLSVVHRYNMYIKQLDNQVKTNHSARPVKLARAKL